MNNNLQLEGTYSSIVNFAMQQNYIPIVKKLNLKNTGETDLQNVDIRITAEPEFAHPWSIRVDTVPAGRTVELDAVNIKLIPEFLFSLTERMAGALHIKVMQSAEVLESVIQDISVLAFDQWSGVQIMPELISAFITPNNPKVTGIVIKAGQILAKWPGNPSFTGYQSKNPNTVRQQMAALYFALQSENITYCVPPASFEEAGQRIRLSDTVLTQKMGTCLDLTLLYAGCLEAVGLHPMIVFTKGHAFLGCWLEDECFAECLQDDVSTITKRIAEGIFQICLVECTSMVAGKNIDFEEAVKLGNSNLDKNEEFEFVIDVKRTRGSGIRPIPQRKLTEDGRVVLDEPEGPGKTRILGETAPTLLESYDKIQQVDRIEVSRQQIWERKLLDLSLRNTLISFRVTNTVIRLMTNQLNQLEDALAGGDELELLPRPKDLDNTLRDSRIFEIEHNTPLMEELIRTEFQNKRIRTVLDENEVSTRITNLYRAARVSLEENGANTLYLALGFLKWYESGVSEKARYAPLVLVPVDIVRKSVQKGYIIRIRDEEPQMNITLLEMLRQDFGLNIGGLDPLPTDEKGIDLKRVFSTIRQAVLSQSRWDVEELAFLGLFSFSQFIMWNDIRNRVEDLKQNRIVSSLLSGKLEWNPGNTFPEAASLDEAFQPVELAVPVSADSSQLSAVCAAGKDSSFVLHGPPGTGKSQTITNIIANALFQGKSVLFVAEKMAALSVVQKRLEAIGLGPFCLELHSNKAKKKDVLSQLEAVLEHGKTKSPEDFLDQAHRLHVLRQELNLVVEAIHRKRDFGFSLYDAFTSFEQNRQNADCIAFSREQVKQLTPQQHVQWMDAISQLKTSIRQCDGVTNHPLADIHQCTYSQNLKSELKKEMESYSLSIVNTEKLLVQIGKDITLPLNAAFNKLDAYVKLQGQLLDLERMPVKLFDHEELDELNRIVQQVCINGKRRDELEQQILQAYREALLTFDQASAQQTWDTARSSWFLPKFLGQQKVLKSLKIMAINPGSLKMEHVPALLGQIAEYKANAKAIQDQSTLMSEIFGLAWNQGKANWTQLEKMAGQAVQLNTLLAVSYPRSEDFRTAKQKITNDILMDLEDYRQRNSQAVQSLIAELQKLIQEEMYITGKTGIDFQSFHIRDGWLTHMGQKVQQWLANLEGLRNWCAYLNVRSAAVSANLGNVITACETGKVAAENLQAAFQGGLAKACIQDVVDGESSLSSFQGNLFEDRIERFRETCRLFEEVTRYELVARLSSRIPQANASYANSSEIGILQKTIRSGGRAMSIRKLFDAIPNLLRKLCPCMLMSPISVAQYIDPLFPKFDLVVFDEASQLPTCEAVGAIARGQQAIVVGDPKQLPPTSFFSVDRVDEDNFDKEDLESILDDCLALNMPQTHLLWHYRSRHESLIAFSNMQYYDNKLYTFPSPNDLASCVRYVPVDGFYDRGKSKQNRAEAEAVVAEIGRRLEDPERCRQSIGVVTFSSVQQSLINDLLDEAFRVNPPLEEASSRLHEPIFVKNLENVQGDERDVILFSIGYGPDGSGKTALNFGPLNREGGWRRLNVAVSRARMEMMVFSALKPEHLDLSRTSSQGVAGLKAFLEFAQKGKNSLPVKLASVSGDKDSLEKLVAEKLKQQGYEVHTNIGCSEYRINIGVVHPQKKEEYLLGIMLDGKNFQMANNARDRHLLQDSVLKSLGWNIHHLWVLDWWDNPDQELKKVTRLIDGLLKEGKASGLPVKGEPELPQSPDGIRMPAGQTYARLQNDNIETDSPVQNQAAYTVCRMAPVEGGADAFLMMQNSRLICDQIRYVLAEEAPISRSLLMKRILNAWGISRAGTRIDTRFTALLGSLQNSTTRSDREEFIWNNGQTPETYDRFRVPADESARRSLDEIPPEELANAVRHILDSQVSLLRSDLLKEISKLFGFARSAAVYENVLNEGIELAVNKGFVKTDDSDRVIIC